MTRLASNPMTRQDHEKIFDNNRFYTLKETAALISMSIWTLREWIAKGKVKARRTPGGRMLRIHGADLNAAFAAAESNNPGSPRVRSNGAT